MHKIALLQGVGELGGNAAFFCSRGGCELPCCCCCCCCSTRCKAGSSCAVRAVPVSAAGEAEHARPLAAEGGSAGGRRSGSRCGFQRRSVMEIIDPSRQLYCIHLVFM